MGINVTSPENDGRRSEELRACLERARAKYFAAKEQRAFALSALDDHGLGLPESRAALRKASEGCTRALREYARALADFSKFVDHGVTPLPLNAALGASGEPIE